MQHILSEYTKKFEEDTLPKFHLVPFSQFPTDKHGLGVRRSRFGKYSVYETELPQSTKTVISFEKLITRHELETEYVLLKNTCIAYLTGDIVVYNPCNGNTFTVGGYRNIQSIQNGKYDGKPVEFLLHKDNLKENEQRNDHLKSFYYNDFTL